MFVYSCHWQTSESCLHDTGMFGLCYNVIVTCDNRLLCMLPSRIFFGFLIDIGIGGLGFWVVTGKWEPSRVSGFVASWRYPDITLTLS